jgi:hypothetical protein
MEFTSMPSGAAMAAVARKRAELIRVNFILNVWVGEGEGEVLFVC